MSNPLFKVVQFDSHAFRSTSKWPVTRRRAFERTLRETCILYVPDGQTAEAFTHLFTTNAALDTITIQNLDDWVDILLSDDRFGSTIEIQGSGVLEVLRPATQSCRHVLVLDPYFVAWPGQRCDTRGFSALVEEMRDGRSLLSVSRIGTMRDSQTIISTTLGKLAQQLSEINLPISSLKMYFYQQTEELQESFGTHDRFYCFRQRLDEPSSALALSVGYGSQAFLETDKQVRTCLARIKSALFEDVWGGTVRLAKWFVSVNSYRERPGGFWRELKPYRRRTKAGLFITAWQKSLPG